MGSRAWVLVSAAIATAGLAGCANPYQKEGLTGGFAERRISDTAYFVSFAGNGFASRERVQWFWLYRCAELTLQQKHGLFVIEAENRTSSNAGSAPATRPAVYRAEDRGRFVQTSGPVYVPIYTPGVAIQTFSSAGTVLMYDRPLPQELVEAWDAQGVKDALEPYVKSDGKSIAPTTKELGQRALVTHDDIGVQSIGSIEAAAADTGTSPTAKPLRTEASVRAVLDSFGIHRTLRTGYRAAHAPGSAYRAPATAAWDITISPNGPVTSCQLVSETLNDSKLVQDMTAVMQHLNFGPQDVGETRVKGVIYYFRPLD